MKPDLYLITNDFPFGKGEDSFILPELPYLTKKFKVTIISNSLAAEQTCFLDDEICVVHYDRKASIGRKICDSISYLGASSAHKEVIQIFQSGEKIPGRIFESILFFEEARRFERFIKKNHMIDDKKPVIIYCYWFTYYCLTMLRFSEKHPNIKVITRAHRYDLYDEGYLFGRQPFKEQMNRKIGNIIFIAEHGRQYYRNKYGEPEIDGQYQLFRLGVRPLHAPYLGKKVGEEFLLVSCAQVISRKRVELIVDALTHIRDFRIRWIHFGGGNDYEKLRGYAEEKLGSMENISYELRGYVASEQIMEFYGCHYVDAFITTTASEGCPVSVQEAMAYAIPVIGTAVAEIPHMIDGNGVLLSETPTAEEVATGIRNIYNQSVENVIKMREKSYRRWKKDFNAEINAERFVEFLYRIL
ncbi:glycosyltransferase [Lachnospiraceae bacterium 54-11]